MAVHALGTATLDVRGGRRSIADILGGEMTFPRMGDGRGDRLRLAGLALLLAASVALYVGLALLLGSPPPGRDGMVGFSLPSAAIFRAFTGLPSVGLSPTGWSVAVALDLALLWALLGGGIAIQRAITDRAARKRARRVVLAGAMVMLALGVVAVPPLFSSDLYRQAIFGRMVCHGVNPYAVTAAASGDPLLAFTNQTAGTTIYGPAYTLLSALTVALFPASPLGVALGWKTVSALAAFGCVLLAAPVARALSDAGGESRADEARLWLAWNPLLILETAGTAHIESVMMLPALAGLLLLQRGQARRAVALLAVATLTKWVAGALLVLALIREVRRAPPASRLRRAVVLAGVVALVMGVLYLPFARGLSSGGGIHAMVMRGAGGVGAAVYPGPPQWARMAAFAVVLALVTPFATAGRGPRLVAAAAGLVLLFVLVIVPWVFPWYLLAPIVLAVVLPAGRPGVWLRFTSLGLAAGLMLYYAKLLPLR